jgi:hypothetical protein
MSYEITRANNTDRDRYANHVPELFTQGYITEERMFHMLDLILEAETLHQLDDMLEGLPRPKMPPNPKDYGIPRNFLPAGALGSLVGLTLAVGPSTALSGHHGAFAVTVAGLCVLWGIWITVVSVIATIYAAVAWDDLDDGVKKERRKKDNQRR